MKMINLFVRWRQQLGKTKPRTGDFCARCNKTVLFCGILLFLLVTPAEAQISFSECGTFEMDPVGQCLVFYPDDPTLGEISADLGTAPLPPPGTYGLLSGTAWDCAGICFPTLCISGGIFEPCNPVSEPEFIRGDCNNDMSFNIADVIYHLHSLFAAGPPAPCRSACNLNLDNVDDISDSILMLSVMFQNTTPPPAPYPDCGPADPGNLILGCQNPICP